VFKGIGVPVITDYEIWKDNPEKVFGVSKAWADQNPNTLVALTKALIRACKWLDENNMANRKEAVEILSRSEYVGADAEVIANSMTGTFEYEKGDKRSLPDFNVFFKYNATYPYYSDCIWYLSQMRRWGQVTEAKSNEWYQETARKVYLPDVWLKAANALVEEGHLTKDEVPSTDGFKPFSPAEMSKELLPQSIQCQPWRAHSQFFFFSGLSLTWQERYFSEPKMT
jgi:nitrate/nitrite transport system substrate-binding protein